MANAALPVLENILRPPLTRFSSNDNPEEFAQVGDKLFFTADSRANGTELWAIDQSSPGASLVADIVSGTGSSYPHYLTQGKSRLFFVASDSQGESVWQTDGTTAGTVRISSLPKAFGGIGKPVVIDGDRIVVTVSESVSGVTVTSLWVTDGTANGTQRLTPAGTVRASFDKPTIRAGNVYFSAATKYSNSGGGLWRGELWRTDGTPERTIPLVAPSVSGSSPVSATPPSQLTAADDGVYFVSDGPAIPFGATGWQGGGMDVWCYRETEGTLVRVTDAKSDSRFHAYFHSLTPWKGRLFFAAQAEVVGYPWQMFVANGPAGGVASMSKTPTYPSSVTAGTDGVYFRVDTYDYSKGNLWRSDGTDGGTTRVDGSRWPTTSIALVDGTVFADSARLLARMAPDDARLVELSQATVRFKPWSPMSGLGNGMYFWGSGSLSSGFDTWATVSHDLGATRNLSMAWRTRTLHESFWSEPGGDPTQPPLQMNYLYFGMASDVMELSGFAPGEKFVIQMHYVMVPGSFDEETNRAEAAIHVSWLNPNLDGGTWENAVYGNIGAREPGALWNFDGSWAASGHNTQLGSWGVDIVNDVA